MRESGFLTRKAIPESVSLHAKLTAFLEPESATRAVPYAQLSAPASHLPTPQATG